jgi:hypothetical protein
MTRPWTVMIAGVALLLVAGLAIKSLRGSRTDEPAGAIEQQVAQRAQARAGEQGGWTARKAGEAGTQAADRSGSGPGSAAGTGADRFGSSERGSADVVDGVGGRRSGVGLGTGTTIGPDGGVRVETNVAAQDRPEGAAALARDRMRQSGVAGGALGEEFADDPLAAGEEDESGLVLSLPLEGTAAPETGNEPVVIDGVVFDSEGAKFTADSQLVIPNPHEIIGESGTISFWVQPDWSGDENSTASLVDLRAQHVFENRIQIDKNGQFLRFIFADDSGRESGGGYQIGNWQPGEWHHVTATWGEALTTLYVDGRPVAQQTFSGEFRVLPQTQFRVGSNYPGDGPGANSTMSHVQVYKRVLTPDEVGQISSSRGR